MTSTPAASSPHATWAYAALALPLAFAGLPLYVLVPDLYAQQGLLSLSSLAALLLGLRLFDAVFDPWLGQYRDRHPQRLRALMPAAAALLCGAIGVLMTPNLIPNLIPNLLRSGPTAGFAAAFAAAQLVLGMLIAITGHSVLAVNQLALGAAWRSQPEQQTQVSAIREGCGLVGLILAISLPSLLRPRVPEAVATLVYCTLLAVLMAAALAGFRHWARRALLPTAQPMPAASVGWWSLLSVDPLPRLLLAYLLSMLAMSIPSVLVLFFIRDQLGAEALTGGFLLLYFLAGAAAMPLWQRLSRRWGSWRSWQLSMLLAVAVFVGAFALQRGQVAAYALICLLSGISLGADLCLPPALLAAHMHTHACAAHAGRYAAALTMLAKIALSLASVIALPLLDWAEFRPGAANSPTALRSLSAIYALLPCLLKLLAALVLGAGPAAALPRAAGAYRHH